MDNKKILFLSAVIFFVLIPCSHAQDDLWIYRTGYILLDSKISTGFDIISQPGQEIDYIRANITFFPKQTKTQAIMSSQYEPQPKTSGEVLTFEWKSPQASSIPITITNRIKTTNSPLRITSKVKFPLKEDDIPKEYKIYTKEAEIIDINSKIISLASDLAGGEDDMFKVVDKMAFWVNSNVQYNLSTITKEAAQKSSWVMDNREGVCDEITSLFISLLRSVGIPARFVSGIAYTNLDIFESKWGPHGWAEVYFPGHGWVPYDVTFGEYGWIDAAHIQARESEDAGKLGSQYVWRAEEGVSLKIKELKADVDVIQIGDEKRPEIEIRPYVLKENTGFGSYNLVAAEITNLADYYQSADVLLAQTNGLENINENSQHVLLEPGKTKKVYWVIRVQGGFSEEYIYTFPLAVYTLSNASGQTTFISVSEAPVFSLDEINFALNQMKEEETKTYSKDVKITCSLDKTEYYTYERPAVNCLIRNEGNVFLRELNVCLEDECKEHNIGIAQEKEINFTVYSKNIGVNDVAVTAKNDDVSKAQYLKFTMFDEPEIDITSLEYPKEVRYKEMHAFKFVMKKESYSLPEHINLKVDIAGLKKEFDMRNLSGEQEFVIEFSGSDLRPGQNNFTIDIDYKDGNEKDYEKKEAFAVSLVDVTIWQRIVILLKHLI